MKQKIKIVLIAICATLALIGLSFFIYHSNKDVSPSACMSILDKDDNEIKIYQNLEDDNYYLFLPSYLDTVDCKWELELGHKYVTDGNRFFDGDTVDLKENNTYTIEIDNDRYSLKVIKSANLPTLYIDTISGSMTYLDEDKDNEEQGYITLINEDGSIDYIGDIDTISGRGNSSWEKDKKGYGFELSNCFGLLGMSESKKYVLIANSYDDSDGLRNYIAYNMGLDLGLEYTSEIRFVDAYFNGQYWGTYQLVEKIQVDENHIDIEEASSKNVTGGYVIERNTKEKLKDKGEYVTTKNDEDYIIRIPSKVTDENKEYVLSIIQNIEDALFSNDYKDSNGIEVKDLIDLDSWVERQLIDEITKNEGAGVTSCYYYLKQDDET